MSAPVMEVRMDVNAELLPVSLSSVAELITVMLTDFVGMMYEESIAAGFVLDEFGGYVLDQDGGRIADK